MYKKLYLGFAIISLVLGLLIIGLMIAGKLGEKFNSYALLSAFVTAFAMFSRYINEKNKE